MSAKMLAEAPKVNAVALPVERPIDPVRNDALTTEIASDRQLRPIRRHPIRKKIVRNSRIFVRSRLRSLQECGPYTA